MKATLTIDMRGGTFGDYSGGELARILREVADKVDCQKLVVDDGFPLFDVCRNRVGKFTLEGGQ